MSARVDWFQKTWSVDEDVKFVNVWSKLSSFNLDLVDNNLQSLSQDFNFLSDDNSFSVFGDGSDFFLKTLIFLLIIWTL